MNATKAASLLIVIGIIFFQSCTVTKTTQPAVDQFINGDTLPDAPALAPRGEYHVGVRTLDLINKHQINILKSKNGVDTFYDRPLKVEIWYPAILPADKKEFTTYEDVLGSPLDS